MQNGCERWVACWATSPPGEKSFLLHMCRGGGGGGRDLLERGGGGEGGRVQGRGPPPLPEHTQSTGNRKIIGE